MDADLSRRRQTRCPCSRRDFLARGLYGIGIGASLPFVLNRTSAALAAQALQGTSLEKHPERILVVIELSGGNDGLNTVVPYADDVYRRRRPSLALETGQLLKIDGGVGLHPSLKGMATLLENRQIGRAHV